MVFDYVENRMERHSTGMGYEDVPAVVHPGYTRINNPDQGESVFDHKSKGRDTVSGMSPIESYNFYLDRVREEVDNSDSPALILYEEGGLEDYQNFIDQNLPLGSDIKFIETRSSTGELTQQGLDDVKRFLTGFEQDPEIKVMGEQKGRCPDQFVNFGREELDHLVRDFNYIEGCIFSPHFQE